MMIWELATKLTHRVVIKEYVTGLFPEARVPAPYLSYKIDKKEFGVKPSKEIIVKIPVDRLPDDIVVNRSAASLSDGNVVEEQAPMWVLIKMKEGLGIAYAF